MTRRRRRRSTARGLPAAIATDRPAGRRRDHARRRLDRVLARAAAGRRLRCRRAARAVMSPVAAPADKRFRRAHVKPSAPPPLAMLSCARSLQYGVLGRAGLFCLYRGGSSSPMRGRCRSTPSPCAATCSCRGGVVTDALRRPRRARTSCGATSRCGAPALLAISLDQGRGPAARASLDDRGGGSGARADRSGPHRRRALSGRRLRVLIDAYGPYDAQYDLPIVDGLPTPEKGGAAGRRSGARRHSPPG